MRGCQTRYAFRKALRLKYEAQEPDIAHLFYGDLSNETPEQFILRQEEATILQRAIDQLDARHARVIRCRYGMGVEPMLLDEVGEQYGVHKERIRQMQAKAERKLLRLLRHEFKDRYKSLAKRRGWDNGVPPTERELVEAAWKRQSERDSLEYAKLCEARDAREAEQKVRETAWEAEQAAERAARVRQQHSHGFYVPRLINVATGEWEWVRA